MYSLYTILKMSLQPNFYIFMGLYNYLVHHLMSRRNKSILICDINDQNTKFVIAFKGTHVVYLNRNL